MVESTSETQFVNIALTCDPGDRADEHTLTVDASSTGGVPIVVAAGEVPILFDGTITGYVFRLEVGTAGGTNTVTLRLSCSDTAAPFRPVA